jgi:NitT/TauT family transport system ATP-binding protein
VSHSFVTAKDSVQALREISFTAGDAEFLSVVGPSGCGKTTLLRIIAGLVEPTSGQVNFKKENQRETLRAALVFQQHGLLPWCTVVENVALGLEFRGVVRSERERRAREFVNHLGMGKFLCSYPGELSVGMRQRVALARAFVADPRALLLDEPFGSIDAQTRLLLQEELLRIWRRHHKLVVHVTHDIEEAIILADKVLVLSGRPGTVREKIEVPLPRPRSPHDLDKPEIAEIKWRIWEILRDEVRATLGMEDDRGT